MHSDYMLKSKNIFSIRINTNYFYKFNLDTFVINDEYLDASEGLAIAMQCYALHFLRICNIQKLHNNIINIFYYDF